MQMLPNKNDDNLSPLGKFLGWLPFIAGGIAVFWFWGTIVPFVKATLKDSLLSLIYGGALAVILLTLLLLPKVFLLIVNRLFNFL